MIDEIDGVIKYKTDEYRQETPLIHHKIYDLNHWRYILFQLYLIGEYPDGVGFGNLSRRYENNKDSFIITASQTGGKEYLGLEDYSLVSDFNLESFSIKMTGIKKASSEALTHAAIFQSNKDINYIFHIHSRKLWNEMMDKDYLGIEADIQYGTIEMAKAFEKLTSVASEGIIVMKGHQDGILAYGPCAKSAGNKILETFKDLIRV